MTNNRYYGPYRGIVVDNQDPSGLLQVRVRVPDVLGDETSAWALPCVSPGVSQVPDVGAAVWVVFERGDPAHPVWIGTTGVPGRR